MKSPIVASQGNRKTTQGGSSLRSSVRENALAIAPPAYGIDFVDSGKAAAALARAGAGGGHTVPQVVRSLVEAATGADLGGVRLHTGNGSQQAARMLNARAYTVGSDIHFARGQYRPGGREGDRLIAHELVHTIQQGPGTVAQAKLDVSAPGDAAEVEADAIASMHRPIDGRPLGVRLAQALDDTLNLFVADLRLFGGDAEVVLVVAELDFRRQADDGLEA